LNYTRLEPLEEEVTVARPRIIASTPSGSRSRVRDHTWLASLRTMHK